MTGLRVELEIPSPEPCPVTDLTATVDAPAKQVTWSENENETIEQFSLERADTDLPAGVTPVFEYGGEGVYEFVRSGDGCASELIEASGHPIANVRSVDGSLFVTLHFSDGAAFTDLLDDLRKDLDGVAIRTIARTDADGSDDVELVPVNRSQLTDRQREVIETAYAMGYFEYPREANATEVAAVLDIVPSTLTEHLTLAQSKIFADLLVERRNDEG